MNKTDSDDELAGTEQPFVEHLIELRDRLVRALLAILIGFGVLCAWPGPAGLYDLLAEPMMRSLPQGTKLIATGVFSGFMVPLKITLMGGFLLALPFVLYQVWAFVAPGLYSHEKRFVLPLVVSSTALFFVGVAFCYFLVLPALSAFLVKVAPSAIQVAPDIEQYFGTVLTLFLVFGIAFEVPVAVVVLAALGIVKVEQLREWRGYFAVGAVIVAAIVTPPDVISQLALFLPMMVLYEIGILVSAVLNRRRASEQTSTEV
ncbi:sec-independent protein translocase protein TatC [Inhella inkyongensis]|uniref:Sec-independent protein translocase protein TatC n=1 Tax=Inhella inkyongensis TaxID=392593 RepID=A0A840S0E9_9BURK|nr:twin-arginine translocase subunit TatC [Inhella inkyongensis]MBB5204547.1 sec-independent protein translocase protein TatC [Inhella inkyongensis]